MKGRSLGAALIAGGIFLVASFAVTSADKAHAVRRRLRAMGIRDRPTALRSPWQNAHAERLPAPLNNMVRERQPVLTELSANASAMTYWVSESDAWHVVTTVDIVGGQGP